MSLLCEQLEACGKAFSSGLVDEFTTYLSSDCTYRSDYADRDIEGAENISARMRQVYLNLQPQNNYTYEIIFTADIVKQDEELPEIYRCENCLRLYQGGTIVAFVFLQCNENGKITRVYLSRDSELLTYKFIEDKPSTVNPVLPKSKTVRTMPVRTLLRGVYGERTLDEMRRSSDQFENDGGAYVWKQADRFAKDWLPSQGYKISSSEIEDDCIGYRCVRNGENYTIFVYAYRKDKTAQLDGDYCAKLTKLPYAKDSIALVLYLHVEKTKGEDGKFVYEVQNYYGKTEPFDFWHIGTVQDRNILDYYPRKEGKDMVLRFISAYNQKSIDVFEAIFTPDIYINLIGGGQVHNDGVFERLTYLYENFGKMKLAYLRTNDVIFSSVPYLEGFGYFSFSVTKAGDKISKIEEFPLDGKYEELWVTDIEVPAGMFGAFPSISSVEFLKPEVTARFAVILRFDNDEIKKYVLPIDRNAEGDEVVKYKRHSFTDKIWSNGWLSASRRQNTGSTHRAFRAYGQEIDFINGYSIGAVQLYYDSKPYYVPKICEDVVFEDENLKITKIAEWADCSLYSAGQGYDGDDNSDLIKVLLPGGGAFNVGGTSTFADADGKRATALEFNYMDSFYEGVARVAIDNYGYGFIGEDMNFVIPPKYSHAKDFSEGFTVVVSADGGNYIVDKTGRERIIANDYSGKKYKNIISCSDGMFRVSALDEINFMHHDRFRLAYHHDDESDAGIWGFVNTQGIEVIAPQYIFAYDFVDGIALVCKGKWEEKEKWDERDNTWGWWSEEMLWGFIDKEGNEVIPCKYDEIEFFQNDDYDKPELRYFKAHIGGYPDGKWGVIDRNGNWIDETFFADVDYTISDDDCFAFYAEDKWSADDVLMGIYSIPEKRILFLPQFLDVEFRKDGNFEVEVFDDALGRNIRKIINRQGQPIFASRYSSISAWKEPYEVEIYDDSGDKRRVLHG
ncbi:MAG: WG repeat-containing protein, partial [Clostridiales Family XIII bacterium]|nr:WG repeat-containing protein [Clostridiales Family XIII bacterium]